MAQFNAITEAIVSTFQTTTSKEEDLRLKNVATQNKAIQKLVDAHILACDVPKALYMKGNAATNEARKEVKTLMETLASKGYIENATAKVYQTCFWIAFETGAPFSRDLHNEKAKAKSEATAKAESTAKAGKVEVTTIPEMHKTLSKALAQARILNQVIVAGALLDCIVETYPDFKETVLGK